MANRDHPYQLMNQGLNTTTPPGRLPGKCSSVPKTIRRKVWKGLRLEVSGCCRCHTSLFTCQHHMLRSRCTTKYTPDHHYCIQNLKIKVIRISASVPHYTFSRNRANKANKQHTLWTKSVPPPWAASGAYPQQGISSVSPQPKKKRIMTPGKQKP